MSNKFHAIRTYSSLCDREFDSKLEARRAEELYLLQQAGEIEDLKYQVPFVLNKEPKVTVIIDFSYCVNGVRLYEDTKGVMLETARVKLAWLKQLKNIEVIITRKEDVR